MSNGAAFGDVMTPPGESKRVFAYNAEADHIAPTLMYVRDGHWFTALDDKPADAPPLFWMTYDHFLARAKRRAEAMLDRGAYREAVISMAIDMKLAAAAEGRSGDLAGNLLPVAELYLESFDAHGLRRWITGFR